MENFTFDLFRTDNLRKWIIADKQPIEPNYSGFIKKDGNVVLLDYKLIPEYMDKDSVYVYFLSKENYDEFKKTNVKHILTKMNSIIYHCDEEFFKLVGSKYKDIRYANKMYKDIITVKNSINLDEVKQLIKKWRKLREKAHWRMNTAAELYFLENHWVDNLIPLSFYKDEELVGYSVVERIMDNVYNLLFRKTDTSLTQFTFFVDYTTYKNISSSTPFYINAGDDGGKKDMTYYKSKHFPVSNVIPSLSIKIVNKKELKKLF